MNSIFFEQPQKPIMQPKTIENKTMVVAPLQVT
jgi:hypothetical protein